MPLLVICGQPSSGKSSIAQRIAHICKEKGHEVIVVNEESSHLNRNDSYKGTNDHLPWILHTCKRHPCCYACQSNLTTAHPPFSPMNTDVPSEKNTRALLRSVTDRSLTKNRIVIFDSLNNIKGYRYELWCVARSAATKYLMVHVDTTVDTCKTWNAARNEAESYRENIFEDLAGRFERPDSRNRWDSPLFTVHPIQGDQHIQEVVHAVVSCTVGENVEESLKMSNASGGIARNLSPTCATSTAATLSCTIWQKYVVNWCCLCPSHK